MSSSRLALIGDPVEASLSPAMHQAALSAAGFDGVYEAIRLRSAELEDGVRWLRQEGFIGFNVTVPHKEGIVPHLDEIERVAKEVGAVNTVARLGQRLIGFNTDSSGFSQALKEWRVSVTHRSALVLGAGGAARAITHALLALGAEVTVANRSPDKAEKLRQSFQSMVMTVALTGDSISEVVQRASLVVNATSVGAGTTSETSPLPKNTEFSPETVVVDLAYGRRTALLREAVRQGCATFDGLEMLIRQGAGSFRIWTGLEPDVRVMREACLSRLRQVA